MERRNLRIFRVYEGGDFMVVYANDINNQQELIGEDKGHLLFATRIEGISEVRGAVENIFFLTTRLIQSEDCCDYPITKAFFSWNTYVRLFIKLAAGGDTIEKIIVIPYSQVVELCTPYCGEFNIKIRMQEPIIDIIAATTSDNTLINLIWETCIYTK